MLTPDRLDGHGYAPNRITQRKSLHPYLFVDDPLGCLDLPHEVREITSIDAPCWRVRG